MHLRFIKSYFGLNLSLVVVHVLTEINSARTSPLPLSTLEELHQCQWEALPREKHRETLELLAHHSQRSSGNENLPADYSELVGITENY